MLARPVFAISHQIVFTAATAGWEPCSRLKDAINDAIEVRRIKIKGQAPYAAVELSPRRRLRCTNFYRALGFTKAAGLVEGRDFETCFRRLQLLTLPGYVELGGAAASSAIWEWAPAVAATIGLDLDRWPAAVAAAPAA